jgi:hypothetical protein
MVRRSSKPGMASAYVDKSFDKTFDKMLDK